jgi:hypothetical protein
MMRSNLAVAVLVLLVATECAKVLPACRKSGVAVLWSSKIDGNRLVVMGGKGERLKSGVGESKAEVFNDVWVLNKTADGVYHWSYIFINDQYPSLTIPAARWKHSGDMMGQSLVIYGGQPAQLKDDLDFDDVWRFDLPDSEDPLSRGQWTNIKYSQPAPQKREAATGIVDGDMFWSIDGRTPYTQGSNDTWSLKVPQRGEAQSDPPPSWTDYSNVPTTMHPRRGQGTALVTHPVTNRKLIVVFGGRYAKRVFLSMQLLSIISAWSKIRTEFQPHIVLANALCYCFLFAFFAFFILLLLLSSQVRIERLSQHSVGFRYRLRQLV